MKSTRAVEKAEKAARIYPAISDPDARKRGLLRVLDESGEDYLFPEGLFAAIKLPKGVGKMFSLAT